MTEKDKITLIEEVLEVAPGSIARDSILADIKEYDSLKKLSILIMLEDNFDIKVTSSQLSGFTTVSDILNVMG